MHLRAWRPRRPAGAGVTMVLALLGGMTVACDDGVGPSLPAWEAETHLLFVSDRVGVADGDEALVDLFRTTLDGSVVENLTEHPARFYRGISLSPDGIRLVLESDREYDCANIWVMGPDGADPVALTHGGTERCNEHARWSPDRGWIAFTSSRNPAEWGWSAWVMRPDGSDLVHLSGATASMERSDFVHGWTPDGRAVFHAWEGGVVTTMSVAVDGTGLAPLLPLPGDWLPFWSPDGSRVAFVREGGGDAEVYLMDADGTDLRNLTGDPAVDRLPDAGGGPSPWSPDGTMLAVLSDRTGSSQIHVLDVARGAVVQVTEAAGGAMFGGWSPDGDWLAFTGGQAGSRDVYLVRADGTGLRNVTSRPGDDAHPVWVGGG